MNWVEIKVKTTTEAIEAVSNIFYEAGVAGVVIEDPKDYLRPNETNDWITWKSRKGWILKWFR